MYLRKLFAFLLLGSIANAPCMTIFGQQPPTADQTRNSPIVISIGRPNIWSLEQAHYLLARMHHRNLRLEPKQPESLDPNSVNGTRVKLLRQILGISADYAQTKVPKDFVPEEKETAENRAELTVTLPESAIKDLEKSFTDPKLNASTELDNLINFQYENIAKQLTLLRDEVGNDERLVFLELPQSIYTTPSKADKRVAQIWWRIEGYSQKSETSDEKTDPCEKPKKESKKVCENIKPIPQVKLIEYALNLKRIKAAGPTQILNLAVGGRESIELNSDYSPQKFSVRTIDLIPRQSSLIVNQTYDSVKGLNLWGGFSWLFGLGVKGSYQRQKEDFEQFLHQDVYASAFGKGEIDFGWTFGPLPGTKRLAPGLRTTYAVVIVPKAAETISLKAKGCFFKQGQNQPYTFQAARSWNTYQDGRFCEEEKDFIIPVPNGGDYKGFWVEEINYYAGQEPGNRTIVSIKGTDFSPQINVMVNGVSLCPSVGIAQPFLNNVNRDNSCVSLNGISGEVEYVGSDELVFSFQMPKEFRGTPTIHLIGPGRSVYLNKLPNVRINTVTETLENADWMFGGAPDDGLAIKDFKLYRISGVNRLGALLIGKKFISTARVYVNGEPAVATWLTGDQISLVFNEKPDPRLNITVIQDKPGSGKDTATATFSNLTSLILNKITVLSYEAPKDKVDGVMLVKVEGSGFNGMEIAKVEGADGTSSIFLYNLGEIVLKLINPEPIVKFSLNNSQGQMAESVVLRPKS